MSLQDEIGEWYDATKISAYRQCPQRYAYRHEDKLDTTERSVDLEFGIAIHAALESIYDGTYAELVPYESPSGTKEIRKFQKIFLEAFPEDPEKGYKTRANGLMLLARYLEKWQDEPFTLKSPPEQTFTMTFEAEADQAGFTYIGRLDLFIEWNGEAMPADHKTTSRFGELFDKQFRLSVQQTGYMKATGTRKSMINAMRVTNNINDESFVRKITTRTEEDIERWERDMKSTVRKIREARRTGIWEQTDSACFSYNRTCEYYALCTSGSKRQHDAIKDNSYTVSEWEPI
jgi:hypothetical protein